MAETKTKNWQAVDDVTDRLPVPGGWIYRTFAWDTSTDQPVGVALVFVPHTLKRESSHV